MKINPEEAYASLTELERALQTYEEFVERNYPMGDFVANALAVMNAGYNAILKDISASLYED